MRYLAPLAILILTQIGAAWAVGDANVARLGGSFATIEAASAAACERACADDTLCMAWSFHANSCELKAIVPAATPLEGVISGVSARAPASMRVRFEPPAPPAEPVIAVREDAAPATFAARATHSEDASLALLGGPAPAGELRGGLGNSAE